LLGPVAAGRSRDTALAADPREPDVRDAEGAGELPHRRGPDEVVEFAAGELANGLWGRFGHRPGLLPPERARHQRAPEAGPLQLEGVRGTASRIGPRVRRPRAGGTATPRPIEPCRMRKGMRRPPPGGHASSGF